MTQYTYSYITDTCVFLTHVSQEGKCSIVSETWLSHHGLARRPTTYIVRSQAGHPHDVWFVGDSVRKRETQAYTSSMPRRANSDLEEQRAMLSKRCREVLKMLSQSSIMPRY